MKTSFPVFLVVIVATSVAIGGFLYLDDPKTPWDCRQKYGKVAEDVQNCLDGINQKFTIIPQAFGKSEETISGFSSIDPPISEITPRKPTDLRILFQYTSGPHAIDNLVPIIEITPESAAPFVHIETEPTEITQREIRRLSAKLTVDEQIQHEKIFLSISFVGNHFLSSSDVLYKSSWTESLTLNIAPKDYIGIALGDCEPIDIDYEISDGKISMICKSQDTNSVKVFVDANSNGTFTLDIPKHILYALGSDDCRLDNDFFVLYDGEEIIYNITGKESSNLVEVDFTSGIHEIEIIGAYIIPDPSPIQYCGIVENYQKMYLPPLDQMQHDMQPSQIRCNDDLILVYKNDNSPACVNRDTIPKLIQRGWIDADTRADTAENIPKFLCEHYGGGFFDSTGECMDLGSKRKCLMLGGVWDKKCIVLEQVGKGIGTEPDFSPHPEPDCNNGECFCPEGYSYFEPLLKCVESCEKGLVYNGYTSSCTTEFELKYHGFCNEGFTYSPISHQCNSNTGTSHAPLKDPPRNPPPEPASTHIVSDTPEIFRNGITKFVNPNHESLKYYKTSQVIDDTYLGKNVQQWQDAWEWELDANYEVYKDEFYEELGRLLVKNEITQVMNQFGIINTHDDFKVHQGYSLLSLPPHIGYTSIINATDGNSYLIEASAHSNRVNYYSITQLTFFNTSEELSLMNILSHPQIIHVLPEDGHKSRAEPSDLIIHVDDNAVNFVNRTPDTIRIQESGTGEIAEEHELAWIGPTIPSFGNDKVIFDEPGIYRWDARKAPTVEEPWWWASHAGGEIVVIADDVDDLPLEDRLRMGRSILQTSEIPTAGMGIGNADNALKISLRSAVYDMLPDAVSYYQDRAEQLVPFDIPIIIENPYADEQNEN